MSDKELASEYNRLDREQLNKLEIAVKRLIMKGTINPFSDSNGDIFAIVSRNAASGEIDIDFTITPTNVRNSIIRAFGFNPGKQNEDDAVLQFTAAESRAPMIFQQMGPKPKSIKAQLAEFRAAQKAEMEAFMARLQK